MAVTRLNANALPYPYPYHHHRFSLQPLQPGPACHPSAYPPHVPFFAVSSGAPFPFHAHPNPQCPYSQHKLMFSWSGDAEKLQARAAAAMKRWPGPAASGRGPRGPMVFPPRWLGMQQQLRRGRVKEYYWRRKAEPAARSPSPVLTTRPPSKMPLLEWLQHGQPVTTVMIRNIPYKLTRADMMKLLDDHCARENKRRGGVVSAYDFLYVPMDFRSQRGSNFGYAFVNLTSAEAARRLHDALHGCRWKMFRSKKIIEICAGRIQGKKALVKHFSRSTFVCGTDAFLPAVFSPPRTGAAEPSPAEPRNVGLRRVPQRALQLLTRAP